MRHPGRMGIFFVGAAAVAALYALSAMRLPGPEDLRGQYMRIINSECVAARHVTDAVTAVNFDYRGFDTLGEEFILFVSVMGALVLLRQTDVKPGTPAPDALSPGRAVGASDALRVWILGMTGPTVLFGIYTVIHGQLTPGGGFQGGVILATAPLLMYLAESFDIFRRITSHRLVETAEAIGAGAYGVIGLLAIFKGREFMTNVFPLGKGGSDLNLFSGGTIPVINVAVGIEVTAGFVLLLYAFLQEMLERKEAAP
ncbi:MAG: Na(+) antiporter subunit [Phycisphaerales bacterium]|nr:Na(+) antiporter subunit [Phycisphaerales bacterium]